MAASAFAKLPEAFRARAVELCWKELTLLGSRGFTAGDIREVIDLYLAGELATELSTRSGKPRRGIFSPSWWIDGPKWSQPTLSEPALSVY